MQADLTIDRYRKRYVRVKAEHVM